MPNTNSHLDSEDSNWKCITDKHIILVDDNESFRTCCSQLLSKHGAQVDLASDGSELLSKLGSNKYDIILLDIGLPGEDGWTLYSKIRNQYAFLKIPVLFVSGYVEDEEAEFLNSDPSEKRRIYLKTQPVTRLFELIQESLN